ncbi:MAG TPA: NUDIX domain-containing protein [Acidimicrobiales bacterium]|nr:NUDIX domain-containing protein [Acidimicrobiales bacterium]
MDFRFTDSDAEVVPIPAATVVVGRDSSLGLEVLMLRRNSRGAFGGMWVFPGGRVDPEDADPNRPMDGLSTARRAAAREAEEEAGISIDPEALVPFAHWVPPPQASRRFSTWFFLCAAAREGVEVEVDGHEIHDHAWLAPSDALGRQRSGDIELAPPTWMTLHGLTRERTVASAMETARSKSPRYFETHIASTGDRVAALWSGDAGYDDADLDRPGRRDRLWIAPGAWRYESSDESFLGDDRGRRTSPDDPDLTPDVA